MKPILTWLFLCQFENKLQIVVQLEDTCKTLISMQMD